MAKRSTPSDKVLVDPLFKVPEGAEDAFAYSREGTDTEEVSTYEVDDLSIDSVDDGYDESSDELDFDDGYDDQNGVTLEVPNAFSVISQVLRRAPGGQQVVDVIIQAEDVPGAVNYEIQVTKV